MAQDIHLSIIIVSTHRRAPNKGADGHDPTGLPGLGTYQPRGRDGGVCLSGNSIVTKLESWFTNTGTSIITGREG